MNELQVHVFLEGRSIDLQGGQLDIGEMSNDNQIREAVATHLGVPLVKLQTFSVDRTEGNVNLRPEAVFG